MLMNTLAELLCSFQNVPSINCKQLTKDKTSNCAIRTNDDGSVRRPFASAKINLHINWIDGRTKIEFCLLFEFYL